MQIEFTLRFWDGEGFRDSGMAEAQIAANDYAMIYTLQKSRWQLFLYWKWARSERELPTNGGTDE